MVGSTDNSTQDTESFASQHADPLLGFDMAEAYTSAPISEPRVRWTDKIRYLFDPNLLISFNSSTLSNAILNAFIPPRNGTPLRIEFPPGFDWHTHRGRVFDWYHEQKYRHFHTLQYRKERQEPFCHEFIILKLSEDWFCRIERFGDPRARVEALTSTGTTAYDMIQLHPPERLDEVDNNSTVVMEITLPHHVDILQVLAICYAIQQDERASHYTLQRYNCYFFSWTIILILARRVARWELMPQHISWDQMIPELSKALQTLSSSDVSDKLVFRITRLLTPRSQPPPRILIDELCPLITSSQARDRFTEYLRQPLWSTGLNTALQFAFHPLVYMAARNSAQNRYVGQAILEEPHHPHRMQFARGLLSMQNHIAKFHPGWHKVTQRVPMHIAVHAHHEITRLSTRKRVVSTLRCRTRGTLLGAYTGFRSCRDEGAKLYSAVKTIDGIKVKSRVPAYAMLKALTQTTKFCISHIIEHIKTEALQEEVNYFQVQPWATFGVVEIDNILSDKALIAILEILEKQEDLEDSKSQAKAIVYAHLESKVPENVVDASQWRNLNDSSMIEIRTAWYKCWERWLWESTRKTILGVSSRMLAANEPRSLYVMTQVNDSPPKIQKINNTNLQTQIEGRIQEHSLRVAAHRLGDAELVKSDIKEAVDNAWASYVRLDIDS